MEILNKIKQIAQNKIESLRPIAEKHYFQLVIVTQKNNQQGDIGFFLHEYVDTQENESNSIVQNLVKLHELNHLISAVYSIPMINLIQKTLQDLQPKISTINVDTTQIILPEHMNADSRYKGKYERVWVRSHGRPLKELREELHKANPDPNATEEKEALNLALNHAVYEGSLSKIKDLINNGADINLRKKNPIYTAIVRDQWKIFTYLLEQGLTAAYFPGLFDTLLEEDDKMQGFDILIKHAQSIGFDLHYQENELLQMACIHNNLLAVKKLVNIGFDLSANNSYCLVCATSDPTLIEYLIKNGANINVALEQIEKTSINDEKINLLKKYQTILQEQTVLSHETIIHQYIKKEMQKL